ncbi:hypothetical protein [Rheinheimera maricola]|uniref:Uncharacterized protein n=1 Tax=Rheinheimera maricola TaxID=2793282 RepID=A0ABS7X598_9GAMM|nr:hypothetical protein [Rheinheimera maricola]MBZ9610476.1 hypothetical protein [Rheinheimera maricola]
MRNNDSFPSLLYATLGSKCRVSKILDYFRFRYSIQTEIFINSLGARMYNFAIDLNGDWGDELNDVDYRFELDPEPREGRSDFWTIEDFFSKMKKHFNFIEENDESQKYSRLECSGTIKNISEIAKVIFMANENNSSNNRNTWLIEIRVYFDSEKCSDSSYFYLPKLYHEFLESFFKQGEHEI